MRTRRSTSGGCLFLGSYLIQHWSRTQQAVSLSSCEAEINALNKGGTEGLGLAHLVQECRLPVDLHVRTDASAAVGVCERVGAGKVKHLSIKQLWAQDRIAQGDMTISKVPRLENMSDLLTHHWTAAEGHLHLGAMGVERLSALPGQQGEGAC